MRSPKPKKFAKLSLALSRQQASITEVGWESNWSQGRILPQKFRCAIWSVSLVSDIQSCAFLSLWLSLAWTSLWLSCVGRKKGGVVDESKFSWRGLQIAPQPEQITSVELKRRRSWNKRPTNDDDVKSWHCDIRSSILTTSARNVNPTSVARLMRVRPSSKTLRSRES